MKKHIQTIIVLAAIGGAAYGTYQLFFSGQSDLALPDEPEISWDAPRRKEKKATKPTKVVQKTLPTQQPDAAVVQEKVAQENTEHALALKAFATALQDEDFENAQEELAQASKATDASTTEEAKSGLIMSALMQGNAAEAKKHIASLDPATITMGQSLNAVVAYHMTQGNIEELHKFVEEVASKNPNLEPQISASLIKAEFTAQDGDIASAREQIEVAQATAQAAGNKDLVDQAQNAKSGLFMIEGQKALFEENDPKKAEALLDKAVETATGESAQMLKPLIELMKMQLHTHQE